jgi:tRNA(adenine34) deaminase
MRGLSVWCLQRANPKRALRGRVYDLVRSPWLNHRLQVVAGVLADDAQDMMQTFFASLREKRE